MAASDNIPGLEGLDDGHLLTPSEVARIFDVDPKTVSRWSRAGKIKAIRTIGGHRRYKVSEVRAAVDRISETLGG